MSSKVRKVPKIKLKRVIHLQAIEIITSFYGKTKLRLHNNSQLHYNVKEVD